MISATTSRPQADITARDAAVSITSLSKRFRLARTPAAWLRGRPAQVVPALTDVTVDVFAGEVFGILGPNGAGKTTLFKILSTLITPDAGTVVINGVDVATNGSAVRRVVTPVIADERSLRWRLSARENLRLFARLYGCPADAVSGRVRAVMETVELDAADEQMVGAFSAGMKQRLALARALLADPAILLLDEPTRSLDPVAARRFRSFLRERITADGRTVILATHDAEEAFDVCDRVGILHRGRLLAQDRGAALREAYADHRYRVWIPGHATEHLHRVALPGGHPIPSSERPAAEGTVIVDLGLDPHADPAAVLAALVQHGVPVARFERVGLSLADLIERVVRDRAGHANG